MRTFADRALRLCGYSVLVAVSGEKGLEIAKNPNVKLDLFVTDVVMPGRGGPSWVCEALQTRPHIRIIFMSGYAEDKLTADQSSVPNSIFLAKPFSLTQLAYALDCKCRDLPNNRPAPVANAYCFTQILGWRTNGCAADRPI